MTSTDSLKIVFYSPLKMRYIGSLLLMIVRISKLLHGDQSEAYVVQKLVTNSRQERAELRLGETNQGDAVRPHDTTGTSRCSRGVLPATQHATWTGCD